MTNLLGQGRELEDVEGLNVSGGTLADVDDHAHGPATAQEALQEVGEFGLPEGHVLLNPRGMRGRDVGNKRCEKPDIQG